jgi:hypothetical protein
MTVAREPSIPCETETAHALATGRASMFATSSQRNKIEPFWLLSAGHPCLPAQATGMLCCMWSPILTTPPILKTFNHPHPLCPAPTTPHPQVEDWLRRIRCGDYVGAFREKDMDGPALSGLYR